MRHELIDALRDATMAMRAAFRLALADLDLTPQQNTVLHLLNAEPGSSSAELARRAHVTPQTMHRLVSDLERRKLVSFQPRPGHGRTLDIRVTKQGQKVLIDADARGQDIEDRMTIGLDARERGHLIDLLQQCTEALHTAPENTPPSDPHPAKRSDHQGRHVTSSD